MNSVDTAELLRAGLDAGLVAVGVASAEAFTEARAAIETRRDQGLHGGMQFTYRNPARSSDPRRTLPGARSLVVGAFDYHGEPQDRPVARGPVGRVAAYAREDHYAALRTALAVMAGSLRASGHRALVLADQNNLIDRAAAHRAGIGWWGKSSNILIPDVGSMVVIGSVLTDADLEIDSEPVEDGCGSCRECLDGCPTGAIVAPGVVDARRCLAWLVQAEGIFPPQYRVALGDRIYGCDDCQDVCPPNRVRIRRPGSAHAGDAWVPLLEMLRMADEDLMNRYGRWYIPRRQARYLRRNALLVVGNTGDPHDADTVAAVETYLVDPDPILRAHAVWAAKRLGLASPLRDDDPDPRVRAELERSVDSR